MISDDLERLRKAFTRFVGQPVGNVLQRTIDRLTRDILMFSPAVPMQDLMVELGLVAVGCGCPRKVCEQLKALNLPDLEFLYEHWGAGPGNMIWLEWATRHGQILGWDTKQESMPEGVLEMNIQPKEPLNFVKIDITLEKPGA